MICWIRNTQGPILNLLTYAKSNQIKIARYLEARDFHFEVSIESLITMEFIQNNKEILYC